MGWKAWLGVGLAGPLVAGTAMLPSDVFGEIMGIPPEDRAQINRWAEMMTSSTDPDVNPDGYAGGANEGSMNMAMYGMQFAAAHRALRPDPAGARGVFYKAPKAGQDRRIDLPALGPDSVEQAARAGLAGIAWQAGGVILLDRAATIAAADRAGVFLWARG